MFRNIYRFIFGYCDHDWRVLSKEIPESKFEMSMRVCKGVGISNIKIPHQLVDGDRKVITIVTCETCGKIKKYVDNI